MTPKTITPDELIALLASRTHAEPCEFSVFTNALKRKTGCPFAEIRKLSRVRPWLGTGYTQAVNRQRWREGWTLPFVARLPGYSHFGGHLVQYKTTGNICLAVQFNTALKSQVSRPVYMTRNSGECWKIRAHAEIAPWVDPVKNPVEAARDWQGVEAPILWRTYSVSGLASLHLGGGRYRIRG